MDGQDRIPIIAIEEHFMDREIAERLGMRRAPDLGARLEDLGEGRLAAMDEAGVDVQVLSLNAPGVQRFDPETAVALARRSNDRLAAAVAAHPNRFAGFATLPTPDPEAAADELARAVEDLGFKGAMVHGLTDGAFIDEPRFRPILARAHDLGVPVYLHPAPPDATVTERYYQRYVEDFPWILSAGWGFTVEAATQGVRMVLSGVFEELPGLQVILGHLGEGLPFLLRRIDEAFSRRGNRPVAFRKTFCEHFHITTSGNFSDPAMQCTLTEMGADRVLFSVDYPFVQNGPAVEWIERFMLNDADRAKVLSGNARRLLKL